MNYYLATDLSKEKLDQVFYTEQDAVKAAESQVKALNKQDKEKNYLYGFLVKENEKIWQFDVFIESCRVLSDKGNLRDLDLYTTDEKNESVIKERKIAIVYKNKKGLKSKLMFLPKDSEYLNPLYLEKLLGRRCGERKEVDVYFLSALIQKYGRFHPYLNKYIEQIEYLKDRINSGFMENMRLCDVVFSMYYDLINSSKTDSFYIDRQGQKISYSYNRLREFAEFMRKYEEKHPIIEQIVTNPITLKKNYIPTQVTFNDIIEND